MTALRTLLLCSRPPWPRIGGDRVRTFHLARALATLGPVDVVTLVPSDEDRDAIRSGLPFVDRFWLPGRRLAPELARSGRALMNGTALQSRLYAAPEAQAAVREALSDSPPDVIVAHLVRTVPWLPDASPPLVVDIQDALSLHYATARRFGAGWRSLAMAIERDRIARAEQAAVQRADGLTFISERDRDHVLRGGDRLDTVAIARAVVDPDRFAQEETEPEPDTIGFVGNLATAPNRDMVIHFARHLLPRIRATRPAARLRIIGVRAGRQVLALARLPGVELVGRVQDVAPELARCWLTICPQRFGSGVQNKVLESLAAGTPTVVSPTAAASLGPRSAGGVVVAPPDLAFVDAVCALLGDPERRRRMSEQGRRFAIEVHGPDVALSEFLTLVSRLAGRSG
jgi:glycosyltransferase involved in cell wall biosynthesis